MDERLHLVVPLAQVEKEVDQQINLGNTLLLKNVLDEASLLELKNEVKEWIDESQTILQRSFNSSKNVYENDFYKSWPSIYNLPGVQKPLNKLLEDHRTIIRHKQEMLLGSLKLLKISEAVINPSKVDLVKRNQYEVDQKLTLIVSKLYELNDENYYSVRDILWGNGIELKYSGEDLELGRLLENGDLVEIYGGMGGDCNIKLKTRGRMFYEQKIKPQLQKQKNMDDDDEVIKIFISHGGSPLWKDVARFIEKQLDFETVSLQEQKIKGRTIIEKLEDETDDCDFAIIIMTAEDEQIDGNTRARQNVIHEIGFCQGVFGRNRVLILKQEGVEGFTNISGLVYEEFTGSNIKSTFEKIRQELEDLEEELNDEDEAEDD